jgi:hypothetical protein
MQDEVLTVWGLAKVLKSVTVSQSWGRAPRGAHDQNLAKTFKIDYWHRSQKGAMDRGGGQEQWH